MLAPDEFPFVVTLVTKWILVCLCFWYFIPAGPPGFSDETFEATGSRFLHRSLPGGIRFGSGTLRVKPSTYGGRRSWRGRRGDENPSW